MLSCVSTLINFKSKSSFRVVVQYKSIQAKQKPIVGIIVGIVKINNQKIPKTLGLQPIVCVLV